MSETLKHQYCNAPGIGGTVQLTFKEVNHTDIKLGQPIPYDVYDRNGMLLMKAGATIDSLLQLNQFVSAGLYMVQTGGDGVTKTSVAQYVSAEQKSFEMTDWLKQQLANVFAHVKHGRAKDLFVRQIANIATHVQEICACDSDAALACLHLDTDSPYIVQHALHAAFTVAMVSSKLEIAEDKRHVMICAALSHDVGLLDLQDSLDKQQTPLTDEQRKRINNHPLDGAKLLEEFGVTDLIWLNTVRQHHERLDGTGYPAQLAGSAIKIPARLLAIADVYSAMLRVRPYRKAVVSRQALRSLLIDQAGQVDKRLVELLIKAGGIFPAGALVKLANGEIAVVKKQQQNSAEPLVYVFVKPDGEARLTPLLRDTHIAEFAVQGLVAMSGYLAYISMLRGLWVKT